MKNDPSLITSEEAKEVLDEVLKAKEMFVRVSDMADPSIGVSEEELTRMAIILRNKKEESRRIGRKAIYTASLVIYTILALTLGARAVINLLNGSSDVSFWGGILFVLTMMTVWSALMYMVILTNKQKS